MKFLMSKFPATWKFQQKKWVLNKNLHGVGLFKTNLDAYKRERN